MGDDSRHSVEVESVVDLDVAKAGNLAASRVGTVLAEVGEDERVASEDIQMEEEVDSILCHHH